MQTFKQFLADGLQPGQKAWKAKMTEQGAVEFRRDTHGGGTVDKLVAYDKAGKVVGSFPLKASAWK